MTERTENFAVKDFNQIAFRAAGKLTLIQGDEENLTITTDETTLAHVKIEVTNGKLVIQLHTWYDFLFLPRSIDCTIHFKKLQDLEISGSAEMACEELLTSDFELGVSGSAKAVINHIQANQLKLSVSGQSEMIFPDLNAQKLDSTVSGSGKYRIKGEVIDQIIRVSGSGVYEGIDLSSQQAKVQVSGTANLALQVHESLTVSISGTADVKYRGNPQVSQHISGAGKVYQVNASVHE